MSAGAWIDVDKRLPVMFDEVIVCGTIKGRNACSQAWSARRWNGCSGTEWIWLTPTDERVLDVTHWHPLPTIPYERPI